MNTVADLQTLCREHSVLSACQRIAQAQQACLYLVGGAVRDGLLYNQLPNDLDMAVIDGSSQKLAAQIAAELNGRIITLDERWGIYRVILVSEDNLTLDFADALENNIERDLARRDLTVNAMAISLADGTLLDPHNGMADLNQRHIRMIVAQNMLDDPLRLLRVFRFAAAIDAHRIDPDTVTCVEQYREKLLESAPERIQYELLRFFDAPHCFPHLHTMGQCGLLEVILPELTATRSIPSNGHHHLGLFDHTLELVNQCERLFEEFPEEAQQKIRQPFNGAVSRLALNKLGCLLHDIGKPATRAVKEGSPERLTFYGHDRVSEEMTDAIARRLRLGNDIAEFVKKLVRWHLYPCQFSPTSSRKSLLRFFRRMGEDTPDVILLALADRHSTLGPEMAGEKLQRDHQNHLWLLKRYFEEIATLKLPPLLTGHDIMTILNIRPGPKIKEVLTALEEAHQLGEIATGDDARAWVQAHFQG